MKGNYNIFTLLPIFLGFFAISCSQENKNIISYPQLAQKENIHSNFGRSFTDEYSQLNNLEDPLIQEWLLTQDSLAESYFSQNKFMEDYLQRFEELQNVPDGSISSIKINEAGNYFYLKFDDSADVYKLNFRKDIQSPEVEILNPEKFDEIEQKISYINPSRNGSKVAIGLQKDEDFTSQILIYDVKNRTFLKDRITKINPDFGGIEWLPDDSGFIYLYFPVVDQKEAGYKKNSFSVLHKLGEDPEKRDFIFGNKGNVIIPSDYYPKVKIGSGKDEYIIGYSASSSDYYDAYIAKLEDVVSGNPKWKPFFKEQHQVFYNQGEVRGDEFIFRQGNDKGNLIGKVNIKNPDFTAPEVLASGDKENPITQFEVSKDKIYFSKSKFGVEVTLWEIDQEKNTKNIPTPFHPAMSPFLVDLLQTILLAWN